MKPHKLTNVDDRSDAEATCWMIILIILTVGAFIVAAYLAGGEF